MGNPFVHVELLADDLPKAKAFYSKLFKWDLMEMPEYEYVGIGVGKGTGGGMMKNPTECAPTAWMSYVGVSDIRATVAKAKQIGATILKDTFDIGSYGWAAVLADAQGAAFALWQPSPEHPEMSQNPNAGNPFVHIELHANDLSQAVVFYKELFDWQLQEFPEMRYYLINVGEGTGGGMCSNSDVPADTPVPEGGFPTFWLPYIAVDDIHATVALALELGAESTHEIMDIGEHGFIAGLKDPQGAFFSVVQPKC